MPYTPGQSLAAKVDDALHGANLAIPDFLKRMGSIGEKTPGDLRDAEARAEIEREQAGRKARKAKARIEKMKAKQAGDLKKMPLTGKAALAALRD